MKQMDGKVVVILGASDARSMGAATARRLAEEGAKLVLAARRFDKVKAVADELGAVAVGCDIQDEAQIAALAQTAVDSFGRLDGAVNYAGVNSSAPLAEVSKDALTEAAAVHFVGTALFIRHMAAKMSDGGSIVTASSLTALVAPPGLAAYAGSKRAADQVVRIAAGEYGPLGIRVNSLAPGFTRSAMTEGFFAVPNLETAFKREIPLGRLPTVENVANAALWLLSEGSAATTGQLIDVTAGQSLRRTPRPDEFHA